MNPAGSKARGTVLVLVLVVVAILALLAISELFLVCSEVGAQSAFQQGQQARAAAMSGIQRAMSVLAGETGEDWRDNPALFQAQRVSSEDEEAWYFTIYAENLAEPDTHRYGLEDEAGKININIASAEMLAALPGMTDELVDCLVDFRDRDDETRPNGAEQDYYDALPHPYVINNGPLVTLETLLLVKGFDGTVVLGEDTNRNGLLEPNEDDAGDSFPPDDGDGQLNTGLRLLATTISYEPDVDREGNPRISLNTSDLRTLQRQLQRAGLSSETASFIVEARKLKVVFTDPSQLLDMTLNVPDPGRRGQTKKISSGVTAANLDVVMDKLTAAAAPTRGWGRTGAGRQAYSIGRVNLNGAPVQVLSALPGIDENTAQRIVDLRDALDAEAKSTTAWIYTQNVVTADGFKKLARYLTARTYQYRVRSFGYSLKRGRFCVLEAVIDTGSGAPRISYLRDLTRLGIPLIAAGEER